MSEAEIPIRSPEDCVEYFIAGETPESDWVIGTEHEKVAIYEDTHRRVPYEGERGIGVLLKRISERNGWRPIFEGDHIVALEQSGASITLEPGGQFELSGAPLATIRETCAEFNAHVDLVKKTSQDLGIVWLSLGVDPLHTVAETPVMPKRRYEIMRSYLPSRGDLALDMMHTSATVQANFDFSDEADMAFKMRTAMGCTPIVSALFANSPISAGVENGFVSKRLSIWLNTDPDRCGILPFVFEPGYGYRQYAEWALDVPMFFLIRDGQYFSGKGRTFRDFMEQGFEGHRALVSDWDMHLTTLFPEVRLKRIIEVRGADAVPRELTCALPALWKGLLYDAGACAAAWELVSSFSLEERIELQKSVARQGLAADMAGLPVRELASELVKVSLDGLGRIAQRRAQDQDEKVFLEPLQGLLDSGQSPGETILEHWRNDWHGSIDHLIDYARY